MRSGLFYDNQVVLATNIALNRKIHLDGFVYVPIWMFILGPILVLFLLRFLLMLGFNFVKASFLNFLW